MEGIVVSPPQKSPVGTPVDSRPMTPVNVVDKSPEVRLQVDGGPPFPKRSASKLTRLKTPPKKVEDGENSECPFGDYGCDFRSDKHEVKKHIRDSNTVHISLLCESLGPMKQDIIEKIETGNVEGSKLDDCTFRLSSLNHLYSSKLQAAKNNLAPVVYSRPFLAHRGGYKMCASWAPFGDGKVTEMLTPAALDENSAFLGRPKAARNPAFGISKFASMDEMKSGGPYLKNDVVYLTIDIDLSDIPAF